jgi:hypothetical protein
MRMLLVESVDGLGAAERASLEAAGHTVLSCFEPGSGLEDMCTAWNGQGGCPLDSHDIDVAVLVRGEDDGRPVPREDGVRCAARAGIPVVEVGRSAGDPFARLLAARADASDVVETAVEAAEGAMHALEAAIVGRVDGAVRHAGLDPAAATCHAARHGTALDVRVSVPGGSALTQTQKEAIAVRAFDAVREAVGPRRPEQVRISVGADAS